MEREVAISNKVLEEFRERLLRWDELCAQLRELYYRYLDLAAFRSEKCFFPGRRCKRSWKRQYNIGDLTLMWTYILNTAPLCGKLMKALAEVEYKIRLKALESLEKHGGVEKRTNRSGKYEIVKVRLKTSVYGYLVLWGDRLYVIWGEFDGLSKDDKTKSVELERRILGVVEQYMRRERAEIDVNEYEVDREYERLWLEVPLSEDASKLLGGRAKAPLALFRNLGWLLSDDARTMIQHITGNPGQATLRLFDWVALAKYAIEVLKIVPDKPLVFVLAINYIARTKNGFNPILRVSPIGTASEALQTAYKWFDIKLGMPEDVFARGYGLLEALRKEAFRKEGRFYFVNDIGAWIGYSNTLDMLIIGDGSVFPYDLVITAKGTPKVMVDGKTTSLAKELAKAIGGVATRSHIRLSMWQIRLLLPTLPTPAFKKTARLYKTLTEYPSAVLIWTYNNVYMLTHIGNGRFMIHGRRAEELSKTIGDLGRRVMHAGYTALYLRGTHLNELERRGFSVHFLNDFEKDVFKHMPQIPAPGLELLKAALEEVAKLAKIEQRVYRSQIYFRIAPYDKRNLNKIMELLRVAGVWFSVRRKKKEIVIFERRSVEAIRRIFSQIDIRYNMSNT